METQNQLKLVDGHLVESQELNRNLLATARKVEARVEQLKEQSANVGAYYALEMKIYCLEAYQSGELATWDLAKEKAEFQKLFASKPEIVIYNDAVEEEEGTYEVNSTPADQLVTGQADPSSSAIDEQPLVVVLVKKV